MIYEEKTLTLKNGQSCTLRSATGDDAQEMIDFIRLVSGETAFMTRYEDEVTMTVHEEMEFLAARLRSPKEIMISAYIDGRLAANAGIDGLPQRDRLKHRTEMGISVLKEFWGLGLGSVLMEAIIDSASAAGYEQLELEVVTENERAIALYKKFGFELYGTRENTFKYRDGTCSACHLMLKRL